MDRRVIARTAISHALRVRQSCGFSLDTALCVYDLAERLGIEVRFVDYPSMEGMYLISSHPHIFISSLRPAGRRSFTCAHEIGHHVRQDGMRVDEVLAQMQCTKFDPIEFAADCFAGALLMPKTAVERAINIRGWNVNQITPAQAYTISNYFGVGYTTVIHHLKSSLMLITDSHAKQLLKVPPRLAQSHAVGWLTSDKVWVVDRHWKCRSVDVEVGDFVFLNERSSFEGECVTPVTDFRSGWLYRVVQPGIGRLEDDSGWSVFVRASRRAYTGRGVFRHLDEVKE